MLFDKMRRAVGKRGTQRRADGRAEGVEIGNGSRNQGDGIVGACRSGLFLVTLVSDLKLGEVKLRRT